MRKPKEIVEDIIKNETDPEKLKLVAELSAANKAEEERIAKIESDNVKLSTIARDALMNGPVGQPQPGEPPIPPAAPAAKTFENLIAEALAKKG